MHKFGHVAELLFTFGLAYVIEEVVHLIWGRAPVDYRIPAQLDFTLFTSVHHPVSGLSRFHDAGVGRRCCWRLYLVLTRTRIGLIIQASLTHPDMVEALGHNVPRVFMLVFGGGCALAGLAGVIGGNAFVTEPGMAAAVGSIVFVVVVFGGMGSLRRRLPRVADHRCRTDLLGRARLFAARCRSAVGHPVSRGRRAGTASVHHDRRRRHRCCPTC